jgi:hypothetical protein
MGVGLAQVAHRVPTARSRLFGQSAQRRDKVPVAVVFGQIPEALERFVEQVLGPVVWNAFDDDLAHLEADRLLGGAAQLAALAQRNQRLHPLARLKGLQRAQRRMRASSSVGRSQTTVSVCPPRMIGGAPVVQLTSGLGAPLTLSHPRRGAGSATGFNSTTCGEKKPATE